MTARVRNICALGGPAALIITLIGWTIAGMLPVPLSPSASADEVMRFYTEDPTRVMIGFVLASVGVVLMLPMFALISVHMLRMEGRTPVLTFVQIIAAAVTVVVNMFPQMLYALMAFRGDRDPETLRLMNDVTWMILFTPIMPFIIQNLAIGIAVLSDKRSVFPRWSGYLNLWVAFAFIPDVLAYFFLSGPFAWNGVFVFWLALAAYGAFLVGMYFAVRQANSTLDGALDAPEKATA
ncbi:hypothetical protein ACFVAV_34210 [Nocardia sp. NPDC057663]|uniref:hypothetical protein n=1 Tax=Nocardia sp. NPDC057663 TaxID=3346201 RepID=UPI0036712F7B